MNPANLFAASENAGHFALEPPTLTNAVPHVPPGVPSSTPYSGWRLSHLTKKAERTTYVAYKEEDINHEHPALVLAGSKTVLCEGYWPFQPAFTPRIILSGTCLYTSAWAVRFAPAAGGDAPRPLSLGLPGDLQRIVHFLKKRRPILEFQIPTQPGLYHRLLIGWQREVLDRHPEAEEIRYTLPVHDYHGYIQHFEAALGEELPGLHTGLDAYVETLKAFFAETWGGHMDKVVYDLPGSPEQKKTETTSHENNMQIYLAAMREDRVMGMEDLSEVALAHEIARSTGVVIPCAVSVLGLPDPYYLREDDSYGCRQVSLQDLR